MRIPFRPATLTALLGATSAAAFALGLGEPMLESILGQPLRARIPVLVQPGETVSPGCITVVPPKAGSGIESFALPGVRAELAADRRSVLISTSEPLNAPVAGITLHADCAGQTLDRDYVLLPDPPAAAASPATPSPVTPAAAPQAPATAPSGTRWALRPGESVGDIARAIYPASPELQQRLAAAIVRASGSAFPEGDPERPAPGALILIPDLRTIGATADTRPPARAKAPAVPRPAPTPLAQSEPPRYQGLPLSAYTMLLQRVALLDGQVMELRARVAALASPAAAPAPIPAVPAAKPPAPAESGAGGGWLAAAVAVALGAAVILVLRKRRASHGKTAASAAAGGTAAASNGVGAALEEARRSMAHGYPERAFELLEQHVRAQPGEPRPWMLFFAILRSQHMPTEFAELAQRFAATRPAPEHWQEVQRLGREFDPANPLYQGDGSALAAKIEVVDQPPTYPPRQIPVP